MRLAEQAAAVLLAMLQACDLDTSIEQQTAESAGAHLSRKTAPTTASTPPTMTPAAAPFTPAVLELIFWICGRTAAKVCALQREWCAWLLACMAVPVLAALHGQSGCPSRYALRSHERSAADLLNRLALCCAGLLQQPAKDGRS